MILNQYLLKSFFPKHQISLLVYRHPNMDIESFNDKYLAPLLDKLSKESNKKTFLLGDFNIDLVKLDTSNKVSNFLDDLSSDFLLPQILLPTRVCNGSKTVIDDIFCNIPKSNENAVSANLSSTFSDHLPQVFLLPQVFSNSTSTKSVFLYYLAKV